MNFVELTIPLKLKQMTAMGTTKILIVISSLILLTTSCTTTTTKTKNPSFSGTTDSLQVDLNKLVSCEHINLDGKEISSNGKTTSELEIDIINGQGIPSDENQMDDLGKQIVLVIKNALQDKNQYDTYTVLFVVRKESGGVTRRTWKGKVFKSQEL